MDHHDNHDQSSGLFALSGEYLKGVFHRYADVLIMNGRMSEYVGELQYRQHGDPDAHVYDCEVPADVAKDIFLKDDDIIVKGATVVYSEPHRIDEYPDDGFASSVSVSVNANIPGTAIEVAYNYHLAGGEQKKDDDFRGHVTVDYSEGDSVISRPKTSGDDSYPENDIRHHAELMESLEETWNELTIDDLDKLEQLLEYIDSHSSGESQLDKCRGVISSATWEKKYIDYAYGDGPLTAEDLPDEIRTSEAFQEFKKMFGWPEEADGAIEPLPLANREFDSEAKGEFLERFLSRDSLDPSKNMNNFRVWLISKPHDHSFVNDTGITDIYGAHPVLHRLHVLMPEVMNSLRMLLNDLEARHNGSRDGIAEELSLGTNGDIVKAIMIVYEIAGRLLKVDDMRRQQQILFPDREPTMPDITDAHTALSQ